MNKYVLRLSKEWLEHDKIVIAVDYDSTIFPWHTIDNQEDMSKVITILKKAYNLGAYIIVNTCSNHDRYSEIKDYCKSINLPIDGINTNAIELPLIWCDSTYMISLYSLLLRAGQTYGDISIDPFKFLEDNKGYKEDISLIKSALPKLRDIIKYGPLKQDFSNLRGDNSTHNLGIVAYKLDYEQFKKAETI